MKNATETRTRWASGGRASHLGRPTAESPMEAERRKGSFPVRELTYYLDGGKAWTEVRGGAEKGGVHGRDPSR